MTLLEMRWLVDDLNKRISVIEALEQRNNPQHVVHGGYEGDSLARAFSLSLSPPQTTARKEASSFQNSYSTQPHDTPSILAHSIVSVQQKSFPTEHEYDQKHQEHTSFFTHTFPAWNFSTPRAEQRAVSMYPKANYNQAKSDLAPRDSPQHDRHQFAEGCHPLSEKNVMLLKPSATCYPHAAPSTNSRAIDPLVSRAEETKHNTTIPVKQHASSRQQPKSSSSIASTINNPTKRNSSPKPFLFQQLTTSETGSKQSPSCFLPLVTVPQVPIQSNPATSPAAAEQKLGMTRDGRPLWGANYKTIEEKQRLKAMAKIEKHEKEKRFLESAPKGPKKKIAREAKVKAHREQMDAKYKSREIAEREEITARLM